MHSSRQPYLLSGILICLLLCTEPSGTGAGPSPLASSSDPAQPQPTIPMLDEGKGIIHLDVSVINAEGEPVSGLSREDFALLDEGRPQKIASFHAFGAQAAAPDPPAQVILFVDTLGLSSDKAFRMEVSIETFLRQNSGHVAQPASIFGLSEDGFWTVAQHDSTDGNVLASDLSPRNRILLDRLRQAQHPLNQALRALGIIATGQRRKRGRKVFLWIGPGCGPTTDVVPPDAFAIQPTTGLFPVSSKKGRKTFDSIYWFTTLLREARLSIDEISVDQGGPCSNGYQQYLDGPRTVQDADQRFLYKKVLAIRSGGIIEEGDDLVATMNRCVRRARSFYTLSFDPPTTAQPREFQSLHVLVDKPGLLAHTNTSYYDEPFFIDQPDHALRHGTLEQLDQLLSKTASRGRDDRIEQLSRLELTERVSFAQLSAWTDKYRGQILQQALIGAADASGFLAPPPTEIPKLPSPDDAAQQHMLALTKNYLEEAVPKLPDFYATRTTARYEETPQLSVLNNQVGYQPLHVAEMSKARVLYRRRDEVVEPQGSEPDESSHNYLITHGTFGPFLAEVRRMVETPGRMKWLRWESGPEGARAVFWFDVPAAESTYFEGGCCLPDADGENWVRIQAGYREEVAIDPGSGTILRLQKQFDLHDYVPINRDEVLIDYGPVKIGGKTYVCPVRSVGIGRARSVISLKLEGLGFLRDLSFLSWGPYSTKINDMRFSNYHIFRSESRILPGFNPAN